jgi:hypothetical protein
MPKNVIPIPVTSEPGVNVDSSAYSSRCYLNGQWIRFYTGADGLPRPKKIGGYKLISYGSTDYVRSMFNIEQQSYIDLYIGYANSLIVNSINETGNVLNVFDRTPVDFVESPYNVWVFDFLFTNSFGSANEYIFATACPNYDNDLNNNVPGEVYYGSTVDGDTAPLEQLGISTDGGIVVVGNAFLFVYGSSGVVWSLPGDPTTPFPTENTYPTDSKVIAGLTVRGGGVPSCLFWTLNNLVRATFAGTTDLPNDFTFDIVAENISIASPRSVVFANGEYYWIGIDCFYRYNGIVEPMENKFSTSFFFDNLNYDHKAKIHGIDHNFYHEIWWFWPKAPSIECNMVTIYNYKLQVFFNLELSRSASLAPSTQFSFPIMADSVSTDNLGEPPAPGELPAKVFPYYMHEYKVDQYLPQSINAIYASYETSLFSAKKTLQNVGDVNLKVVKFEPDFSQFSGEMEVQFGTRQSPQSAPTYNESGKYVFDPSVGVLSVHEQGGLISLRFISNVLGGDFYAGEPTMYIIPGDERLRY